MRTSGTETKMKAGTRWVTGMETAMGTGRMQPLFCLFLGMCWLAGCVPMAQSGAGSTSAANTDYARTKMLVLEDKIYEPDTRTVLFYANTGKRSEERRVGKEC